MPTALLLENVHPSAVAVLANAGFEVRTEPGALDEDDLIAALGGVQVLGLRSRTHLTARVLDAAPDLRAVGAYCIGTNQIDVDHASARGVGVFNAPYSNTRSVVELTLANIIALSRRLTEKNADMHAGVWKKSASGSHEIRGKNLGIIGYGNIGSQLSVLAESVGLSVAYYDTADKLALGNARRADSLEELLQWANFVSLHVDGRPGNAGFFGAAQIEQMRPGAMLLNLSRGIVVDHEAIAEAIRSGHLAGAAVDVFPHEPKAAGDPFESSLRGLPNVILTPHVGGSTQEAQESIGQFVSGKLRDYMLTGSTTLSVNLPRLSLPQQPGTHRLAHLHLNVPGVLATINGALAEHGVNVESQMLSTQGELGYVVTDVAGEGAPELERRLLGMVETIRLRVLS